MTEQSTEAFTDALRRRLDADLDRAIMGRYIPCSHDLTIPYDVPSQWSGALYAPIGINLSEYRETLRALLGWHRA